MPIKPIVINTPLRRWQCVCGTFYPHSHGTDCAVCQARLSRILAGEVRPARVPLRRAAHKPVCKCGNTLSGSVRNTTGMCAICSTNHWATVNSARKRKYEREKARAASRG